MKVTSLAAFALALFSVTVAGQETEDPGPSPTESIGCEPHGDHWHCDGPKETGAVTTTPAGDESSSVDPGPSPTSSGCHPHGDHWHCPDPTGTAEPTGDEEHDDPTGTEDPGPSPTESVGCEPHGDHWHCDAPATGSATPDASSSGDAEDPSETGAAAALGFDTYSLAGVVALAALFPAI